MPPILNAQGISKAFGAAPLFQDVWFTVAEGDRIGLIGPNGSGKSTLLQILMGRVAPDSGAIAVRKLARLSYVAQESQFASGETVRSVIEQALAEAAVPLNERAGRAAETLGRVGFEDFDLNTDSLSGGWRKRLAIAEALVQDPDVLLLDEPRTIWTWPASSGWRAGCKARRSPAWSSVTTAISWKIPPPRWSS